MGLTLIGQGQRKRSVPVSAATLAALRAHWADRARASDAGRVGEAPGGDHVEVLIEVPAGLLLAPIFIPPTDASRQRPRQAQTGKNEDGAGFWSKAVEAGYTADGLNRLIGRMTEKAR